MDEPVPVSYTVTSGQLVLILVVLGIMMLLLASAASVLLILRRRMEEIVRRESQTTAAVDRLAHMISTPEQAWFWTPEWQAGERQADQDIAAGRLVGPMAGDEFEAYLDRLDAEADAERRVAA